MQRMTCAHELGHLLLHKNYLRRNGYLLEMELFNIQNDTELEANIFAAELLIDENELQEMLSEEYDMIANASSMNINVNLLMIKLIEMQKADHNLHIPFTPDSRFLGSIEDKADAI